MRTMAGPRPTFEVWSAGCSSHGPSFARAEKAARRKGVNIEDRPCFNTPLVASIVDNFKGKITEEIDPSFGVAFGSKNGVCCLR